MLDDSSHEGFTWGMWKNKAGNFALKPWFYTWSLLTRCFPRGCRIMAVEGRPPDVRMLAACVPGKQGDAWSFCVVNRANVTRTPQLAAPAAGRVALRRYVYSRAEARADADGFPVPVDTLEADLAKGYELACPPESVVFLTSVKDE
jgi:hypothetical protein